MTDPVSAEQWQSAAAALHGYRWRQGRKLGRTVYAQLGDGATDDDILLGMMDTADLAHDVVAAHNYWRGAFAERRGRDAKFDPPRKPDLYETLHEPAPGPGD